MTGKRTVPQSVFDNPDALRVAKQAHKLACDDLARKHPSELDRGNPNHPCHEQLFGYDRADFMARQYK